MNINLDDPKLTAYALDELAGSEKEQIETAVASSPEAQEFVRELRLLSGNLRAEYAAEREAHPIAQTQHCAIAAKGRAMEHVAPAGAGGRDRALRLPRCDRDRDGATQQGRKCCRASRDLLEGRVPSCLSKRQAARLEESMQ